MAAHIEITEKFVRLYVFLAQSLDRCLDQTQRDAYPEEDHQGLLNETQADLLKALAVNPVVKEKVANECERVMKLVAACLQPVSYHSVSLDQVKREREALRVKLIALSDLLAVFRAQ
jgi:hypothetical protein